MDQMSRRLQWKYTIPWRRWKDVEGDVMRKGDGQLPVIGEFIYSITTRRLRIIFSEKRGKLLHWMIVVGKMLGRKDDKSNCIGKVEWKLLNVADGCLEECISMTRNIFNKFIFTIISKSSGKRALNSSQSMEIFQLDLSVFVCVKISSSDNAKLYCTNPLKSKY